ncbi:hypothetical protein NARC_80090 [Candidatus Nitrosocosmicus arcticus]|uniref:Uncharacterized protein n=1 Tax=Candidatus Nitrosocosmicus arcticus TaxID=2035267 RepID=A0A557SUS8_9ARCH|nr:hypothetical protein NARC_80090 [Candidatus Nitrosocosmicus arcticus]
MSLFKSLEKIKGRITGSKSIFLIFHRHILFILLLDDMSSYSNSYYEGFDKKHNLLLQAINFINLALDIFTKSQFLNSNKIIISTIYTKNLGQRVLNQP